MQVGESITRQSASNLAFAFVMLPREKRRHMASLYAFCREIDDVADNESIPAETRRRKLEAWRKDIQLAASFKRPVFPVSQELQATMDRYNLPGTLFEELLSGVESDLDTTRYKTHKELRHYCYQVASVVGLLSIEIFGYKNPQCRDYAVQLGLALQYTNILRDVWSDAKRNRIYLPQEDLRQFQVREKEILSGNYSPRYRRLAQHIASCAKKFYKKAACLLPAEDRLAMAPAETMGRIYWTLLRQLESHSFNVFAPNKMHVSKSRKICLLLLTWIRLNAGLPPKAYD